MLKRFTLLSTLLLLAAACGDGSVNINESGTLEAGDMLQETDSSFQDPYEFETKAGANVTVTMTSTDVSPYLISGFPNGQGPQTNGDGTTATLTFTAPEDGRYVVFANAAPGETGAYTIQITATPGQ